MPRCTHKGCGQEYDQSKNAAESCTYHSGAPVFHEGLKSWSCCSDVNKPVLDFDEFMKIPGCTRGFHSDEAPQAAAPKAASSANFNLSSMDKGTETYSAAPVQTQTAAPLAISSAQPAPAPVEEEEEEDLSAPVPAGTKCRHNGCNVVYESDELHRKPDGEATVCTYHPKPPIFHEGSKGYICCKRRVLEFEEFLKIEGCKIGRHVFVPKKTGAETEQFTECRIDHYQTPSDVHVSVFAKKADQERSTIKIEETAIHLDLYLPGSKRFRKSIELFGLVDVQASTFKYYGTKVELHLKKLDGRSWTILEKPTRDLGPVSLTFGVGGRTGTIGAKEIVLDDTNRLKRVTS